MRGRSRLLKRSYRVTGEHISFGFHILMGDRVYRDEILKFYEGDSDILLEKYKRGPPIRKALFGGG